MIWCWWSGSPTPRSCTRPIRTTQDWIWTGLNLPLLFPLALSFLIHPLLARIVCIQTCLHLHKRVNNSPLYFLYFCSFFVYMCVCLFFYPPSYVFFLPSCRVHCSIWAWCEHFVCFVGVLVCFPSNAQDWIRRQSFGQRLDEAVGMGWVPARKFTGLYLVPFSSLFITPLLCFIFR